MFGPFQCENGYRLCPFWSGIGFGFLRELREFTNVFVILITKGLSNDDIISTYVVLKTGIDFRGQLWKRVWKMTFFGVKKGQDDTPPPGISRSIPPGKTACFLYSIPLQPAVRQQWDANPRTKDMKWVALPFVVLYRRNRYYLGIFITCVRGRFLHLFREI